VGYGVYYPTTIPDQPAYEQDADIPVARQLVDSVLSLPVHPHLTTDDIDTIINTIRADAGSHNGDQNSVPVAVVGAGNMGANHIRVYDELPDAELVGVVEPDPDQAREIADQYRVPVVDRVADLEGARAVTVAVPNRLHREVAETCINEGMDVLVEKPLATTIEEAEAIVEVAAEAGAVLQVGHIERFNPAVEVLDEILKTRRSSP